MSLRCEEIGLHQGSHRSGRSIELSLSFITHMRSSCFPLPPPPALEVLLTCSLLGYSQFCGVCLLPSYLYHKLDLLSLFLLRLDGLETMPTLTIPSTLCCVEPGHICPSSAPTLNTLHRPSQPSVRN